MFYLILAVKVLNLRRFEERTDSVRQGDFQTIFFIFNFGFVFFNDFHEILVERTIHTRISRIFLGLKN